MSFVKISIFFFFSPCRVVTKPAKPFVFVEGPVETKEECFTDVPCLQLANSSREYVHKVYHMFLVVSISFMPIFICIHLNFFRSLYDTGMN